MSHNNHWKLLKTDIRIFLIRYETRSLILWWFHAVREVYYIKIHKYLFTYHKGLESCSLFRPFFKKYMHYYSKSFYFYFSVLKNDVDFKTKGIYSPLDKKYISYDKVHFFQIIKIFQDIREQVICLWRWYLHRDFRRKCLSNSENPLKVLLIFIHLNIMISFNGKISVCLKTSI